MQATTARIEIADLSQVDLVAPLFDQYRQFYGQQSDLPRSRHFVFDRTINHESVIFLALSGETPVGFAQLYPSWSSLTLQSLWVLNDLFVLPAYRRQGIGAALVNEAIELCKARGDKGLQLETMPDNTEAQRLYESLGFRPDDMRHYHRYV